jgi:hypothetical protein
MPSPQLASFAASEQRLEVHLKQIKELLTSNNAVGSIKANGLRKVEPAF